MKSITLVNMRICSKFGTIWSQMLGNIEYVMLFGDHLKLVVIEIDLDQNMNVFDSC